MDFGKNGCSEVLGIDGANGGAIGLAPRIDGCAYPGGLVVDEVLASLHKLFPLRPAAIDEFACLLLALVHQGAYPLSGLLGAGAQVFRSLAGSAGDLFAGLTTALGGIQNPRQGAHAQPRQKPPQLIYLVILCHDESSPSAQSEECLSLSKFPTLP